MVGSVGVVIGVRLGDAHGHTVGKNSEQNENIERPEGCGQGYNTHVMPQHKINKGLFMWWGTNMPDTQKDISTPPGPELPCGWGCWGWGSRGLGGPWGQTCLPASPSWPPLPFSWPSRSTPGCPTSPHRPQGGHLQKGQTTTHSYLMLWFKPSLLMLLSTHDLFSQRW